MTELIAEDRSSEGAPRRRSVQSIKIGYMLLDALAAARAPLPLKDLARVTDMQPSKARRYLVSFLDCHLVQQVADTGFYELGPMAIRLGLAAMSRLDPIQKTVDGAKMLSKELDRTMMVAVWSERGPVIIAWFDSSDVVACNLRVGMVLPITASGSGKLFLTYLPRKTTQTVLDRAAEVSPLAGDQKPALKQAVDRIIENVSREGIATTTGDLLPGLHAIAAPIFDSNGTIAAVLAEVHRKDDTMEVAGRPISDAVIDTAAAISQQLGHGWLGEVSQP